MALPPLITKSERDWLFKVTGETSKDPVRDKCLLALFFGTPMTTLEINRVQVRDVIHKSGKLNKDFDIRGELAYNGQTRKVYLSNPKLKQYILDYLNYRVANSIMLDDHPDHKCFYLGLDGLSPLLCTNKGKGISGWRGFSIAKRATAKGNESYTCDALNRHIKQLLSKAGVENPSVLSGRRTFAVNLQRSGFDPAHIHHLLGNKSLETTTKLLKSDPVDMGRIAAEAF